MGVCRPSRLFAALLAATAAFAAPDPEPPKIRRLIRTFDWSNGFPFRFVTGVEQDRAGFLWITTPSGLFLFDGSRARLISREPKFLLDGSKEAGRLILMDDCGRAFEGRLDGIVPLDRDGVPRRRPSLSMAAASDGAPWRVRV